MSISIVKFKKVKSTNDEALELLKKGVEPLLFVFAEEQKSGRGRFKRQWYSPKGGLYLSVGMYDDARARHFAHLAAIVLIRVTERISGISPMFKLPNDVYLGRKIGGILMEVKSGFAITGMGLNLNIAKFPKDLKEKATSLLLVTGRSYNIDTAASIAVEETTKLLDSMNMGMADLVSFLRDKLIGIGEEVRVKDKKRERTGILRDLTDDMKVVLEEKRGVIALELTDIIDLEVLE